MYLSGNQKKPETIKSSSSLYAGCSQKNLLLFVDKKAVKLAKVSSAGLSLVGELQQDKAVAALGFCEVDKPLVQFADGQLVKYSQSFEAERTLSLN